MSTRLLLVSFVSILVALNLISLSASSSEARVVKVLPTLLDRNGKNSLSPSLYERDAYQAILRKSKELVSALRFDVQWKAPTATSKTVTLRLELRATAHSDSAPLVFDQEVHVKKHGTRWSRMILDKETYSKVGQVVAWKISIIDQGKPIAQRTSFLW